jgi:hypothetical protein
MKEKIEAILKRILPKAFTFVEERVFLDEKSLIIGMAASNHKINGVAWQYPQFCALMLHFKDMDLHTQHVGGSGGGKIYRKPDMNNPKEKFYAMKGVKIPFRKPQPTEEAVLKAVERFAQRWIEALKENREVLMYQNIVDYDELLN